MTTRPPREISREISKEISKEIGRMGAFIRMFDAPVGAI
jgi:hypothetical protein